MNLVFDIDDTITKETEFMLEYAPIYLKKKYNSEFNVVNPNGSNVAEVFGLKDYFTKNDLSIEEAEKEAKGATTSFWNSHFVKYMFYPIKKDAPKIINWLYKQGYNINFASLRGKKDKEKENLKEKIIRTGVVPFLTKIQLKINGIKYNKLFLVEKNEDKIAIINELKAKMIFDDSVEVLEKVDNSIAVCVETPHNILVDFENENVVKAPFDYDSIRNLIRGYEEKKILVKPKKELTQKEKNKRKIKNLKVYQRLSTEAFYKVVRLCGKGYVMKSFKPLVIGEENLPKEKGPDVFVGNHRNIKDPIIIVSMLKNPVHFAALKRMFEYNENMFGKVGKNPGTVVTTLFVKSMGALPIARPTDDDYARTNLQTFKYISDYLAHNSAVAIYPEGTLNRHPEIDGNILPLKSNQSFKIAENGKAVIRPIAVVWVPKEIDIENRVVIAFLKPIYTNGLKATEIAERWTNSVNNAIDSINKIIDELVKIKYETYSSEGKQKVKILTENIKHL